MPCNEPPRCLGSRPCQFPLRSSTGLEDLGNHPLASRKASHTHLGECILALDRTTRDAMR